MVSVVLAAASLASHTWWESSAPLADDVEWGLFEWCTSYGDHCREYGEFPCPAGNTEHCDSFLDTVEKQRGLSIAVLVVLVVQVVVVPFGTPGRPHVNAVMRAAALLVTSVTVSLLAQSVAISEGNKATLEDMLASSSMDGDVTFGASFWLVVVKLILNGLVLVGLIVLGLDALTAEPAPAVELAAAAPALAPEAVVAPSAPRSAAEDGDSRERDLPWDELSEEKRRLRNMRVLFPPQPKDQLEGAVPGLSFVSMILAIASLAAHEWWWLQAGTFEEVHFGLFQWCQVDSTSQSDKCHDYGSDFKCTGDESDCDDFLAALNAQTGLSITLLILQVVQVIITSLKIEGGLLRQVPLRAAGVAAIAVSLLLMIASLGVSGVNRERINNMLDPRSTPDTPNAEFGASYWLVVVKLILNVLVLFIATTFFFEALAAPEVDLQHVGGAGPASASTSTAVPPPDQEAPSAPPASCTLEDSSRPPSYEEAMSLPVFGDSNE